MSTASAAFRSVSIYQPYDNFKQTINFKQFLLDSGCRNAVTDRWPLLEPKSKVSHMGVSGVENLAHGTDNSKVKRLSEGQKSRTIRLFERSSQVKSLAQDLIVSPRSKISHKGGVPRSKASHNGTATRSKASHNVADFQSKVSHRKS